MEKINKKWKWTLTSPPRHDFFNLHLIKFPLNLLKQVEPLLKLLKNTPKRSPETSLQHP